MEGERVLGRGRRWVGWERGRERGCMEGEEAARKAEKKGGRERDFMKVGEGAWKVERVHGWER